jgi:hypothetical protein
MIHHSRSKNITTPVTSPVIPVFTIILIGLSFSIISFAHHALAQAPGSSNPNSSAFKFAICDGPAELNMIKPDGKIDPKYVKDQKFIPCNFAGLMLQVRHLITIMLTAGVFVAILGFSYAGYLYMTGIPGKITQAHGIFKQVGVGFIIMLSAWFVVYQVLSWLTGNPGLKALLGTP